MADGIAWELANLIKERCAMMTVAGGYNFEPKIVRLEHSGVVDPENLPAIAIAPTADALTQANMSGEFRSWVFEIVYVHKLESGGSELDLLRASRMLSDLSTAMYRNPSAPGLSDPIDAFLGGKAEGIRLISRAIDFGDESIPYLAVQVDLQIDYSIQTGAHSVLT